MYWKTPALVYDRKILLLVAALVVAVPLISLPFVSTDPFGRLKVFFGGPTLCQSLNLTTFSQLPPEEGRRRGWEETDRVAICLVGSARRFELTGPSLVDRVLNVFNNSDLFLHIPLDKGSYKFFFLNNTRRISAVRIFHQERLPETKEEIKVMTSGGSPNGMQGLLHYFKLVEGCLNMIDDYQTKTGVRYDWIVRTRADGYWSAPLTPNIFIRGKYAIPSGCQFAGLNDRFGAGDLTTSCAALARFSVIPWLYKAGYSWQNSESAFQHQLKVQRVQPWLVQVPFCIVSERTFHYPAGWHDTIVASINTTTPLDGSYCRPCEPICTGWCALDALQKLDPHWSWVGGEPQLCDSGIGWEGYAESYFDSVVAGKYVSARKEIGSVDMDRCAAGLDSMKSRATTWDAPSPTEICRIGLS